MVKTSVDSVVIDMIIQLQKGQGEIKSLIGDLKNLKKEVGDVDKSAQVLNQGLKAFSWTAFAQGALNVSTALVQVATSFSNLERVQYQAKASAVAVEKAQDQIGRKLAQLTKEIDTHGSSTQKATQLIDELRTAEEQLIVKKERLAIAQGNVNETYALFYSNIANTGFGVLQTLISLKTMMSQRAIAAAASQTIENGAQAGGVVTGGALIRTNLGVSASLTALTAAIRAQIIAMLMHPFFAPAVLATIAVGLTAYAVHLDMIDGKLDGMSRTINESNSSITTLNSNINTSTQEVDGLTQAFSGLWNIMSGAPSGTSDASASIDEQIKAIKRKEAEMIVIEARRMARFHQQGRGGKEFSKLADIITPEQTQAIKTVFSDVMKFRKDLIELGTEENKALEISLKYYAESIKSQALSTDYVRERVNLLSKENAETEKGNKIRGNTLKLEQQIMALKKKLSPRSLLEEAIQSASTGEFTRNFIARVMGDKAEGMIGYQPFRGVKSGMDFVEANVELMRMDQKMAIIVSEMEQQILAGNPERVAILRDRLKKLTSGPNVTKAEAAIRGAAKNQTMGGNAMATINALKTITNKINGSAFFKGQTFTTSELTHLQMANLPSKFGSATLASIRAGSLGVVGLGFGKATDKTLVKLKTGVKSLTRASRSKGGGKGGRSEFYQHEIQSMLGIVGGVDQEVLDFLGIMNPFTSLGLTIEPIYNEIRSYAEAIGQLRLKSKFDLPSALAKISTNLGAQVESTVSLRYSRIGISTSGQLKEVIGNPLTYDDIDNRLRYTDRLAQISTGATIL